MASGSGGRRFPSDSEFSEAFLNDSQYQRLGTRFILCSLEKSFAHKEAVNLSIVTIEHILPRSLSPEWKRELGANAEEVHARLVDTFGNLTLTGYNSELGNLPFLEKKVKLENTHIELNRWILQQKSWKEVQIGKRAKYLLNKAMQIWEGPQS